MDNETRDKEHLEVVEKVRDIAHGVTSSGWTQEEQEIIRSILPSPARVWKSAQMMADNLKKEREDAGHMEDCQCPDCKTLRWWEEPEDGRK